MECDGMVSLWLVKTHDANTLESVMEESYTEDGDFIPGPFASCFGIDHYDHDFLEAAYVGEICNVDNVLTGASYDSMISKGFRSFLTDNDAELKNFNAIILLYNFSYDGNVVVASHNDTYFKFVGTVPYI